MAPTIPRAAHPEQLPWIDNQYVIVFQLVDVGSLVELVISDAVVLTTFMALFEKFDVAYFESLATIAPAMSNPKIVKIAKAKTYFHECLSSVDL